MPASQLTSPPQISFTNWILGGSLISHASISNRRCDSGSFEAVKKPGPKEKSHFTKSKKKPQDNGTGNDDEGSLLELKGFEGLEIFIEEENASKVAKEAEKKRDEATEEESDQPKEKKNDNSGWTAKQDQDIVSMKADRKSWKDISVALGVSKKDVQARWKEINDNSGDSNVEAGGDKEKEKGNKKDEEKGDQDKSICNNEEAEKEGDKGVESKHEENEATRRLKPDDIWTRDDCEILEMLELRYREQKWLQMQAGFYNMTGRMVIADMIKRKFVKG